MKILACMVLLSALVVQSPGFAHGDHAVISGQTAISIASKSVKQLAFKDFGYEVGKLDASWKELNDSDLNVVEVLQDSFIVSAKNSTTKNTIFFRIANNGQVLNVKHRNEF